MKVEQSGVVVTGGASGLGEGIARMVVAGGGSVVIFDLPSSKGVQLAAELGDTAHFVPVDVTKPEQVELAVLTAAEQLGRIDVLVNSAGISPAARVVAKDGTPFPLEKFRLGIEVNLIGAFDVLRNVAAQMWRNEPGVDDERGLIVNIGSIAAFEGQVGQASYSASKGGIVALTLPLARDLGQWGIRVMTICPGTIDTPMVQAAGPELQASLKAANVFPKRLGTAADIADVVRACMETTYLNGDVIRVDAGVRLAAR